MLRYERNDGGRKDSGRRGTAGDCLVRAIAIITGLPYGDVYRRCAAMYAAAGYKRSGNAGALGRKRKGQRSVNRVQDDILHAFGFRRAALPTGSKPTYSEALAQYGACIARTTRHFAALKDGALQDSFDGRTYLWEGYRQERKAASVWLHDPRQQEGIGS